MNDNDLISRAAAISEIDEYLQELDSCKSEPDLKLDGYRNGLQVAIQELKTLTAADAIPVEWLRGLMLSAGDDVDKVAFVRIMRKWQKEQEWQDRKRDYEAWEHVKMRTNGNRVTKRSHVGDVVFDDRIFRVVLGTAGIVSVVLGVFLIVAVAIGAFVLKNFALC